MIKVRGNIQKILVPGIVFLMICGNLPMIVGQAESLISDTKTATDGTITLFHDDFEGVNVWEATGCWERGIVSKYTDTKGVVVNNPPDTPPTPSGPTSGVIATLYEYSTSTTDPDGDKVRYIFDWGDGTQTTTLYYESGVTVSQSHLWTSAGTYSVKVKAQDNKVPSAESGWSNSLTVTITVATAVKITNIQPVNNSAVSGMINISAEVTSGSAIEIVRCLVTTTSGLSADTILSSTDARIMIKGLGNTYYYNFNTTEKSDARGYYIYVAAKDRLSRVARNYTSGIIIDNTPATVTLSSPKDSYWANTGRPTFEWTAFDALSGLSGKYHIQISKNTAFTDLTINNDSVLGSPTNNALNSYTPPNNISDGIYYWRVRARDKAGNLGIFSSGWMIRIDTLPPTTPSNCWATTLNTDYPNNANDSLTSPTIDLIGAKSAKLTFKHWYRIELNPDQTQAFDGGVVEVTTDDRNWTKISPIGGYPFSVSLAANNSYFPAGTTVYSGLFNWGVAEFNLSSYIDSRVRIRFRFASNTAGRRWGWYIDDIFVNATFPFNDVGVMAIGIYNPARRGNPYREIIPLGCPIKIHTMIRNYGINNQTLFNISCIITRPDNINETLTTQMSLTQGDIMDTAWQYVPRQWGKYKIKVLTALLADSRPENNEQRIETIVTDYFSFLDDVEYRSDIAPLVYSNQSVINSSAWQVVNYTYHNDTQAWWCGNNTTGYYNSNTNAPLTTPQIHLPNNLSNSKLSFWTKYHLEGSQWVVIGWPDRNILCTNSADINIPGSHILNISATEIYTYDNISFGVASADALSNVTWYFGDGEIDYGELVNHSYKDDGIYTAYAVIRGYTEEEYAKLPAEIIVLNRPPVPYIDAYRLVNVTLRVEGKKGNTVTMTLLEDNVTVGETSVTRQLGDPDKQSKTIELKARGKKTYQALLRYNGSNGGANPVKLIFTIEEPNGNDDEEELELTFNSAKGTYQEKLVEINTIIEELLEDNREAILDASKSYDLDGYITTYLWDFGDGTNGTGKIVKHTFPVDTTYNVTLNVTDDDYATSETTTPVELSVPIAGGIWPVLGEILPPLGVNINYDLLVRDWLRIRWRIPPLRILWHHDNIWVEITKDNETYEVLDVYPSTRIRNSSNIPGNINGWIYKEYDISSYIKSNITVSLRMKSDSCVEYEGAYIDDILINGTYNGLIPQSPSFSFYAEAYRGSTNITDVYIHLYPMLLEPIPNVVDEIKLKLLDKNNNTIATKTYSNVTVESKDVIHFHDHMNCTYINAGVNIKGEVYERRVFIYEIPDIINPANATSLNIGTKTPTPTTKNIQPTKENTVAIAFYDNMESGTNKWETYGVLWAGYDFDMQSPYSYSLWHQTVERNHSSTHSWVYNIEAVKNYDLQDYLNDVGIWLGPLVRRHWGRLCTKGEIDLRMFQSVNLTFWTWWDTELGAKHDQKIIEVSIDGGKTWKTVKQITEKNSKPKQWQEFVVGLSMYCRKKVKIGFKFDTRDTKFNRHEGWYIDDVMVYGELLPVYVAINWSASNAYPYNYPYAKKGGYGLWDADINKDTGEGKVDARVSPLYTQTGCYAGVWNAEENSCWNYSGTNATGFAETNATLIKGEVVENPPWFAEAEISVYVKVFEYVDEKFVKSYVEIIDISEGVLIENINLRVFVEVNWTTGHLYRQQGGTVGAYACVAGVTYAGMESEVAFYYVARAWTTFIINEMVWYVRML